MNIGIFIVLDVGTNFAFVSLYSADQELFEKLWFEGTQLGLT
jgi:hypothetical protein